MILGLLTCSKKKLPVTAPAWLLYSASPRFSQQYQSLFKKVDRVVILSAKWGPIEVDRVLEPYDLEIGQLTKTELSRWIDRCRSYIETLSPEVIHSYLSGGYASPVLKGFRVEQLVGDMYERAAKVGTQGKLRRGERVVCWPINWVLTFVAENRPTVRELRNALRSKGYAEATVQAQLLRARMCPLHRTVDNRLENIYVDHREEI